MTMLFPQGEAQFSGCGRYRYRLTRELGGKRTITFVMLNPSTADASKDDPTIRRCKAFAKDWGYGRLIIVNLYAFRATEPREMWAFRRKGVPLDKMESWSKHSDEGDIVGEDNDSAIGKATCEARHGDKHGPPDGWETPDTSRGIVVCAWGKGGTVHKVYLAEHAMRVERVARLIGGDLFCLGVNGDGSPKHPLYLPEDTEPQLWRGP